MNNINNSTNTQNNEPNYISTVNNNLILNEYQKMQIRNIVKDEIGLFLENSIINQLRVLRLMYENNQINQESINLINLQNSNLENNNLQNSNAALATELSHHLQNNNLQNNLQNSNLQNNNLQNSNLENNNLQNSNLENNNLQNNNLQNSNLQNNNLQNSILGESSVNRLLQTALQSFSNINTANNNVPISMVVTRITDETQNLPIENLMNLEPVPVMPSLELLRKKTYISINEDDEEKCTICLSKIEKGNICRVINGCNHKYHIDCIERWFEKNINCPICRKDLREIEEINQENRNENNENNENINNIVNIVDNND